MIGNEARAPTVSEALVSVMEASQQLLADRLELAVVEVRDVVAQGALRGAFVLVGALLLVGAIAALDVALVDGLGRWVPRTMALVACAALDSAIGGALLVIGLRDRVKTP